MASAKHQSPLEFLITSGTFTQTRLPSLFSDLAVQRTSNPEGFAANATAWRDGLTSLALARRLPQESMFILHTGGELLDMLASRQYGKPTGLGAVIDQAVREGKMLGKKEFLGAEGRIYERGWRVPSLEEVVRWSLRRIGILGEGSWENTSGGLRVGEVVVLQALEEVGRRVVKMQEERVRGSALTGRLWGREEFARSIGEMLGLEGKGLGKEDMDVLLKFLWRDRGLLSYNDSTIKFSAVVGGKEAPEAVTSEDVSIANLHSLITSLNAQIQELETQVSATQAKAANAVKNKNKQSALAALRSKALATKQLEQRQGTLQQLEDVYAQIESAADQVTIVETLKSSAGVLKNLNKKVGDVSSLEDVMDDLREEMQRTGEVQGVLAEPLGEDNSVVDGEVDEEFEVMEREEREGREREEAERTRRRLEEVEKVQGRPVPAVDEKTKDAEVDVDEELAKSVERLEGMNLDDRMRGVGNENEKEADRVTG